MRKRREIGSDFKKLVKTRESYGDEKEKVGRVMNAEVSGHWTSWPMEIYIYEFMLVRKVSGHISHVLNPVREEKSSNGIFLYRAIENLLIKMFALIVNFTFSRFQGFASIIVSAFVIQSKNCEKF